MTRAQPQDLVDYRHEDGQLERGTVVMVVDEEDLALVEWVDWSRTWVNINRLTPLE